MKKKTKMAKEGEEDEKKGANAIVKKKTKTANASDDGVKKQADTNGELKKEPEQECVLTCLPQRVHCWTQGWALCRHCQGEVPGQRDKKL